MSESEYPALKEMFDAARFRNVARALTEIDPRFDQRKFLKLALAGLEDLTLLQRLRRMTESLHETLPTEYGKALRILKKLAPRLEPGFVTLFLPDYVAVYGLEHFDLSMDALKFFTPFGSSEFGVRPFLRQDLTRTLAVMEDWSRDADDHVRRLASEGCRPRLPWSFRLDALIADPSPVKPILENLRSDSSLYVRKSVANHLNDITKDHPDWVFATVERWPLDNAQTAWIVKRALRTLIKRGDRRALGMIGAGEPAKVKVAEFSVTPPRLALGGTLRISTRFTSHSPRPQRLVVDYTVHYLKKSGAPSAKVFKWKELTVEPGETVTLTKTQTIKDFTTRVHYPGRHAVDLLINGERLAQGAFVLV